MTVNTATASQSYTGNGSTTVFAVPFYFLADTDLIITRRLAATGVVSTLILNSDYTLTGAGVGSGGALTMTIAPGADDQIAINRGVSVVQQTTYPVNDKFPSASHERALDRLTMIAQQLTDAQSRSLIRSTLGNSYDIGGNVLSNVGPAVADTDVPNLAQVRGQVVSGAVPALGTSSGAGLVGFSQVGANGILRTLQAKAQEQVSVLDYGAIGDGSSHPLSTRFATLLLAQAVYPFATALSDEIDWAAFQLAVNANGGKRVYVPKGTYITNRAISMTTSFVTLEGNSHYSPSITTTSATDDIIRIDCGTGVINGIMLRHLVLDSTVQKTAGAGIKVQVTSPGSLSWSNFEHIRMQPNMAFGIDVMSAFWLSINEVNILGVAANKIGIRLAGQDATSRVVDVKITNTKVIGAGAGTGSTISYGLLIDDFTEGVYTDRVTLESAALDIDVFINNRTGVFANAPKNLWFNQTICDSCNNTAVSIANCQSVKFTDLWAAGAKVNNVAINGGTDVEIKGLTCLVSSQHGVVIGSAAKQVRLLGGVIDGAGWPTPLTYSGISVAAGATDFTITDFDFIRNGSSWVQLYDIVLLGGASDRFIITNNRLNGGNPATVRLNNGVTTSFNYIIKNNIGYNPTLNNIATPTIPASGTAVTNTKGVDVTVYVIGGTVSSVAVGGQFTGQSTSPSTVIVPSGTTVQLFYSVAPTWKWLGN